MDELTDSIEELNKKIEDISDVLFDNNSDKRLADIITVLNDISQKLGYLQDIHDDMGYIRGLNILLTQANVFKIMDCIYDPDEDFMTNYKKADELSVKFIERLW